MESSAAAGIFIVIYVIFVIVMLLVSLVSMALWIWMLVDVIQNETDEDNQKVVWVLIVALAGVIGAVIYLFARRQPRRKAEGLTGFF